MVRDNEKRFIPGTNPDWGLELPDKHSNSLVTRYGEPYNNPFNFDEKDDEEDDENHEITYDNLGKEVKFDPEAAKKAKKEDIDSKEEAK